ncbi:MAG: TrkA family potassium uptake protein [Flavisolibacter sp.]|jgi:trk system potassium uptake protein TrkA|nr:TrkA family potassium uptake protein [Flavisolibacter sp.]
MRYIVFGLGNFGAALCRELVGLGHEVIGVDSKLELVDKFKHKITHTIALDATNREAMAQLPLEDIDAAIVGIGENEGATIMTTALLKQLNVARIICRVTSPLQKIVLEAMNVDEFVYPEASSAERLALKLDLPGVIDSFQINPNYRLLEVAVPSRYVGRSVEELDLANKYRLVLVTIIKKVSKKHLFGDERAEMQVVGIIPKGTVVRAGDILLLFGTPRDLEVFIQG